MYAPRRFRALLDASEFISELDFSIFTMCNTIDPVTLTHPRLVVENAPASDSGPMGHLGSRAGLQPGEVPFWFRTRNPDSPISAAGSNGRCNTIWYEAVFKGGVYETRETVWAFGGAETRRVASLEGRADAA